jgi:hypothetical protein
MLLALLVVPAAAQARDRDGDKLPDRWEKKYKISTKTKSGKKDPDRDGLTNRGEYRAKTNPRRADTDRDGIRDDDEDADRDRVDNGNEEDEGTKPRDRDSDDDGKRDGREDRDRDGLNNAGEDSTGNDPTDKDTDDDGTGDGDEQAGVVASFDGTTLKIDLANGDSVTGQVTSATDVECETEDQAEGGREGTAPRARRSSDDGPGDDAEDDGPNGDADDREGPGSDDGPGSEDDGDDGPGDDEDDGVSCTTADLVPGARVHEAEAKLTAGGLVFTEVELLK